MTNIVINCMRNRVVNPPSLGKCDVLTPLRHSMGLVESWFLPRSYRSKKYWNASHPIDYLLLGTVVVYLWAGNPNRGNLVVSIGTVDCLELSHYFHLEWVQSNSGPSKVYGFRCLLRVYAGLCYCKSRDNIVITIAARSIICQLVKRSILWGYTGSKAFPGLGRTWFS